MKILSLTAVMVLSILSLSWSQDKPKTIDELAEYTGPDREQILLEGAKAEGKVVWYTSLAGASYKTIVKAFREKYPDIEIEVYRSGSKNVGQKIMGEVEAKRYLADAVESTPPILMLLHDKGIIRSYTSPHHAKFPEEAKIKGDGGRVMWVTDRESFIGFGYNTEILPASAVPKSYDDLLRPEFKGKIAMTINSTGDRVVGTMLKYKGKEFVQKLKSQDIKLFKVSGSAMRDLVIAGEMPASVTIFRNHALVKMAQGAPFNWVPMDVVPTNAGGSGLFANAPHPHAALLLIDFIIGPEGQGILEKFHYGVAWKDYPFKREYPEKGMATMEYQKKLKGWSKTLRALGRR